MLKNKKLVKNLQTMDVNYKQYVYRLIMDVNSELELVWSIRLLFCSSPFLL